jgi:hypothetical protein
LWSISTICKKCPSTLTCRSCTCSTCLITPTLLHPFGMSIAKAKKKCLSCLQYVAQYCDVQNLPLLNHFASVFLYVQQTLRIGSTVATGAPKTLARKKIHLVRIFSSWRNAVVLVSSHLARPGHARNGLECNTFW